MAYGYVNSERIGTLGVSTAAVGAVTNVSVTSYTDHVGIKWTDPVDTTLAKWAGTVIVDGQDHYPEDVTDGRVIYTSTVRNAHSSTEYSDNISSTSVNRYYRFFTYTPNSIFTAGPTAFGKTHSATTAVPVLTSQSFTYDGTQQTASFTYDETVCNPGTSYRAQAKGYYDELSHNGEIPQSYIGKTTGTNAGTYYATFYLTSSSTCWADGTWDDKVITWTIDKAAGSISVSSNSIKLFSSNPTSTIDITQVGDGELSITNSNSALVAAALINNNTQLQVTNLGGSDIAIATITIAAAASTNYTAADDVTVTVEINSYSTMTVTINESNSNPATCCTYADDATVMTAGSADWDRFFGHYPCLFKDGAEVVKLDPTDFTKDINGNTVDITSGNAGDVMIAFPRHGLTMSRSGDIITIKMTDNPADSNFEYMAHRRGNTQKDVFYIGAYKGSEVSSKLRSLSGKTPAVNKDKGAFRTLAQANGAPDGNGGSGYDQHGWYQLIYLQCMYVLKYKNLNSQTTVGQGYTNASAAIATGGTETWGMDKKNGVASSDTEHMKLFGIEDLWGNVHSWIEGLKYDTFASIRATTDQFDKTYPSRGSSGWTGEGAGWLSSAYGTTHFGFLPRSHSNGSATTYYCDYSFFYKSNATRSAQFGGAWANGTRAGIFFNILYDTSSTTRDYVGSRLMYI